jgi:hypothetical protein
MPSARPATNIERMLCTNAWSFVGLPSWLTASSTSGTLTTKPQTVTFTINSSANSLTPSTYVNSINFNNTTNMDGSTTRVATLTVSAPNPSTLNISAVPNLVPSGKTTSISWQSTNMKKCTVDGNNGDHWPASSSDPALQSPVGGETSTPITAQTTYTLSCLGLDGVTKSQPVTVDIVPTFCEPGQPGCP